MSSTIFNPPDRTGVFPGLVTPRLAAAAEFYETHFGFRPVAVETSFRLLAGPRGARLALMDAGCDDQPAALQRANRGAGVWLNLEVEDADETHAHLQAAGAEIVSDPAVTREGQRRFIVRDPSGVLVYVTESISPPPSSNSSPHEHYTAVVHQN